MKKSSRIPSSATAPACSGRRCVLRGAGAIAASFGLPSAILAVGGASRADESALRYADSPKAARLALQLAQQTGLDAGWVRGQLARAQFQPQVARLIIPGRPEQRNWQLYQGRFIEPMRIQAGARFMLDNADALNTAEQRFGVPRSIIAGILGVETLYGKRMGDFRVLDSLGTLALDFPAAAPRDRSDYFAQQLGDYLLWCHRSGTDPVTIKGSYAGAIGMPQFMPGNILRWGTTLDGSANVDLIGSADDAIASVGNFLVGHGWQRGQPVSFQLLVPQTLDAATLQRLLAPDIQPSFSAADLRAAGLSLLPEVMNYPGRLAVVQLPNAGQRPDYILGTDNFYALTRYNHSAFYALSVIELGDAALATARG